MKWKCIVCAIELHDASVRPGEESTDEYLDGCLPALDGGGTIDINFGFGSNFDGLTRPRTSIQGAICDTCFVARKNCVRVVDETRKVEWKEVSVEKILGDGA